VRIDKAELSQNLIIALDPPSKASRAGS